MPTRSSLRPSYNLLLLFQGDKPGSTQVPVLEGNLLFEACTESVAGSKAEWKPFQHYKLVEEQSTYRPLEFNVWTGTWDAFDRPYWSVATTNDAYWGYRGEFGETGRLNQGLSAWYDPMQGEGFTPPPADLTALTHRALRSMLPYIRPDLSLLNSLYELKDIKSVGKTIRLVKRFTSSLGGRLSRCLARLLHSSADGYLQAEFNVLPMLSDLCGIQSALSTYERRIRRLINNEGKVVTRHYTLGYSEEPPYTVQQTQALGMNQYSSSPLLQNVAYCERRVFTRPAVFHAEIEYNYNYSDFVRAHASLLGLLDAVGVNFNPRIIWAAIPWSFVVDWLVGVGRFVDNFKLVNLEPRLNIQRYLWSIERARSIVVSRYIRADDNFTMTQGSYSGPYQLPTVNETSYRRDVTLPGSIELEVRGITRSEVTLGAALAVCNKPHPKRKWRIDPSLRRRVRR